MSSEIERLLTQIEQHLARLVAKLAPEAKPKPVSAASVSSVLTHRGVVVTDDTGAGDIPSQLSGDERKAMDWQRRPRRVSPGPRTDRQPVSGRGK